MSLLLGIDIGTSGLKTVLYHSETGKALGEASREYDLSFPVPKGVEQDPDDWWLAACETVREVLDRTQTYPRLVEAVGVGGQGWSCLPVDASGKPLRPAMLWLDRRAEEERRWLEEEFGHERLFETTGNRIDPAYTTPKMLWVKQHEPYVYKTARYWTTSEGYVVSLLTGRQTLSLSSGYGYYFFDMAKGEYVEALAEKMSIDLDTMPPLRRAFEIAGEVTEVAAKSTGLHPGTPVVAGGLDAACAALGAGVVDCGQTQDQGGTAAGMSIYMDRPLAHRDLILGWHVAPHSWLLQGGTVSGGAGLKWFRDTFGASPDLADVYAKADAYELLSREAAEAEPGAGGVIFLPYMAGERSPIWDTDARGAFFGLTFATKRPQLVRAVMEGTAFALQHNLETARDAGAKVDVLFAVGGAARSDVWCQIKADVTGQPIRVPSASDGTALGAAILAGVGADVFQDVKEGVRQMVRFDRAFDPQPENHGRYQELFEIYRGLYDRLKDSMHAVSRFARKE
ncbi:MAG: FGGY-family carbohydrate kinase [Planctomycetes bacterium]|nr:FGGY-family carbohydrate kinase [Planctomycetota bacterium]